MPKPLPPRDVLLAILRYDAKSGKLFWRKRPAMFGMRARHHEKEALSELSSNGYRRGKIGGVEYRAHRVIFKMVHGEEPAIIDHINQNRADNRISNLRTATPSENCLNSKTSRREMCGVFRHPGSKRYFARIKIGQKYHTVGTFDTRDEAIAARSAFAAAHR